MVKVTKGIAYIVESPLIGDRTFTDVRDAEKAIRALVIQEEVDISANDAEQVSEQWDDISKKVKEAMRGL